jgi:polyisoprenoid-binding protein YceI
MFLFRGLLFRAVTLALVVIVAAGAGWWFFIREDAQLATSAPAIPDDLRNAASPTPGSPGSAPLSDGVQRYTILPEQSEAAYFADEKLASLPLPSRAKGSTKSVQGDLYLTSEGLDTSRESTFTVDLRTLRSDDARRDNRVQTQGLETSKFPTATFTATRIDGYPSEFPPGRDVDMKLTGLLSLHGVEREVTWEVKARKEQAALSALATLTFRYADFNIPLLNIANFVTVTDDVTLQVSIIATAN